MERYIATSSKVFDRLSIPSSKSQTLRAILFASLAKGKSTIYNPLISPDSSAMIEACKKIGVTIEQFSNRLEIEGVEA